MRINYEPIPNTGRVHVVVATLEGTVIACGAIPREFWPIGRDFSDVSSASVMLKPMSRCDHGGTHRDPCSIWTGARVDVP